MADINLTEEEHAKREALLNEERLQRTFAAAEHDSTVLPQVMTAEADTHNPFAHSQEDIQKSLTQQGALSRGGLTAGVDAGTDEDDNPQTGPSGNDDDENVQDFLNLIPDSDYEPLTQEKFDFTVGQFNWAGRHYSEARSVLEQNNVLMVSRDYEGGHLKHAVYGNKENGYFYYDKDSNKKDISFAEIRELQERRAQHGRAPGKTLNDLSDKPEIWEAASTLEDEGRNALTMGEKLLADRSRPEYAQIDTSKAGVMVTSIMQEILTEREPKPRPQDPPDLKEKIAAVRANISNQSISAGDLDRILEDASPAVREEIEKMLAEEHVEVKQPEIRPSMLFQEIAAPNLLGVPVFSTSEFNKVSSGITVGETPRPSMMGAFASASAPAAPLSPGLDTLLDPAGNDLKNMANFRP